MVAEAAGPRRSKKVLASKQEDGGSAQPAVFISLPYPF